MVLGYTCKDREVAGYYIDVSYLKIQDSKYLVLHVILH